MEKFIVKLTTVEKIANDPNYINDAEEIEVEAVSPEEAIELAKQHYIDWNGEEVPENLVFWVA